MALPLIGCLVGACLQGVAAGAGPAHAPRGTPLLGADPMGWLAQNSRLGTGATASLVQPERRRFRRAIRAETNVEPSAPWDFQLRAPTREPVSRGDVILASFYLRGLRTTDPEDIASVEFVFEKASSPWDKSVTFAAATAADGQWRRFDVSFLTRDTYVPGQAHITIRLGFAPQSVEIAGLELTSYGQSVSAEKLPFTPYPGRELDAPWRKAARDRIERIRKADLRVQVVDAAGRPLRGATVAVRMQGHAFPFGTAVRGRILLDQSQDRYRELLLRHFNVAVLEGGMKWPQWEGTGRGQALAALEWLERHRIPVRGHNLVWPGWRRLPPRLQNLENQPPALHQAILDHIWEEVTALRGRLIAWDVVNEPLGNRDLMKVLGDEVMVEWFKAAREADPQARLFVNEGRILSGGGYYRRRQDAYFDTIRLLLERGAPLDAIGLQGHFDASLTGPERVLAILDRFATLGKPIWITEFDVDIADEKLQAEFLRDFYTAAFSHPAVQGIVMWGFWDGAHWKGNAPLYRRDWSLKPSGQAWLDLVFGEWWTSVTGTTAEDGTFTTRGFLGDYEIEAAAGQHKAVARAALGREGATVRIVLSGGAAGSR